jgi:hypothetical protein
MPLIVKLLNCEQLRPEEPVVVERKEFESSKSKVAEEDSTEKEEEVLIETMRGWIVVGVE